jgi:hypothetical protein
MVSFTTFEVYKSKTYGFESSFVQPIIVDVVNTGSVEYEDGTTLTVAQTLADRGAHIFTCGYENSSR